MPCSIYPLSGLRAPTRDKRGYRAWCNFLGFFGGNPYQDAAMRFALLHLPAEFEIPDAWWTEAGMDSFTRLGSAYRSTADAVLCPLTEIEPPPRSASTEKDWRGFDRARRVHVLQEIATEAEIKPVPVVELPPAEFPSSPYRVHDGFHRFYASASTHPLRQVSGTCPW
jgi:hypothetical protein